MRAHTQTHIHTHTHTYTYTKHIHAPNKRPRGLLETSYNATCESPAEEDWERELEAELKDYEVVTGNEERSSVETPVRSSGALDKDWEKQIDELLANEDDEDLK